MSATKKQSESFFIACQEKQRFRVNGLSKTNLNLNRNQGLFWLVFRSGPKRSNPILLVHLSKDASSIQLQLYLSDAVMADLTKPSVLLTYPLISILWPLQDEIFFLLRESL